MEVQYSHKSQFWGALWIGLSIANGAFGAHGLKHHLSPEALNWWNTGCQYGVIGGFSLCISSLVLQGRDVPTKGERRIWYCLKGGTLLFCFSLWLLAVTGWRTLGMVTPVGGSLLIAGWAQVAYEVWQSPSPKE